MTDETNKETPNTKTPNTPTEPVNVFPEIEAAFLASVKELIADELANAPEHIKKLFPDTLDPIQQIKWINKAKKSGVFALPVVPATDSRRPNNSESPQDTASLNPIARIASGYSPSKK